MFDEWKPRYTPSGLGHENVKEPYKYSNKVISYCGKIPVAIHYKIYNELCLRFKKIY